MGTLKSFFYDYKNIYTIDDKLIMALFMSIFLHYAITIAVVIGIGVYVLVKSDFRSNIKTVKKSILLLVFSLYLFVVSLLNQNYLGALVSVGMAFLFIVVIYYRKYIHKDLFETGINTMIVLSLLNVVYAVFEQLYYMMNVEAMKGFLDIQNKPQYRVHTGFFNANYYAMMILFVEAFCVYKFMGAKLMKQRMFYLFAGVCNLFALFLTGGRIAWLCLALMILVMLVVSRWYKTFGLAIVGLAGSVGILSLKPNLLPRLAAQGLAIGRRTKIYQTALMMLQDMWLFGKGPLTYYQQYKSYLPEYISKYGSKGIGKGKLGISSQHAHTMFLEPLISFGIVGTLILLIYLGSQLKSAFILFRRKLDANLSALIFGFITITISFCIIDFPIYWVQTALLFMLILGSSEMYKKDVEA